MRTCPIGKGLPIDLKDLRHLPRRPLQGDDDVSRAILSVPKHFADYAPTVTEILPVSGTQRSAISAQTLDAGDVIFLDSANANKATKSSANTSGKQTVQGICLNKAQTAGQPVTYMDVSSQSEINLGATLALATGAVVILSRNAGKMCPVADLASGDTLVIIGCGEGSNKLLTQVWNSGVVKP